MTTRTETIAQLAGRIRQLERSRICSEQPDGEPSVSMGPCSRLGALLSQAGWPRGILVEWLFNGDGSGVMSLALRCACRGIKAEPLVIIDRRRTFHPPSGTTWGWNCRSTIFIRPQRNEDELWSAEQALRTSGIGAVLCQPDKLSSHDFRRLQLAAEVGGGVGVLLRPERVRHQPSWAEYRLLVRPMAMPLPGTTGGSRRRLQVELLRSRKGFVTESVIVELNDADDRVSLAAELVAATTEVRATGA